MSAPGLTPKTLRVSRGYNYTYYVSPAEASKPTLLLLHGWPNHAAMWFHLATTYLVPAGYGVVIPDLLGYDGTDKPREVQAYKWRGMVQDVVDILDAEKLDRVVVLGHDWGASLAGAVYNIATARTAGLAQVCVAYQPPSTQLFDIHAVNARMEAIYGYPCFAYFNLNARQDAAQIYEEHLDSAYDVMEAADFATLGRTVFGQPDGLLNWLQTHQRAELFPHATTEERADFVARFRRDGLTGPLNWYKVVIEGEQTGELDPGKARVDVPYLFVGYKGDTVCRLENLKPPLDAGLLPHLTNITLDGGHWGLVQHPDEFAENFLAWMRKEFA
jgi:pimeloyl-ACP methyl ester carboxylesterase